MARPNGPVDPKTKRPVTFDHLRSAKKPMMQVVDLVIREDALDAYNDLLQALERAEAQVGVGERLGDERLPDLKAEHDKARKAAEKEAERLREVGDVVQFKFRGIGSHNYDALMLAHGPTDEQVAAAKKAGLNRPSWNQDTFPQALVAAALVEPELTETEVCELWKDDNWNMAELGQMFAAALNVNEGRRRLDLPKG